MNRTATAALAAAWHSAARVGTGATPRSRSRVVIRRPAKPRYRFRRRFQALNPEHHGAALQNACPSRCASISVSDCSGIPSRAALQDQRRTGASRQAGKRQIDVVACQRTNGDDAVPPRARRLQRTRRGLRSLSPLASRKSGRDKSGQVLPYRSCRWGSLAVRHGSRYVPAPCMSDIPADSIAARYRR